MNGTPDDVNTDISGNVKITKLTLPMRALLLTCTALLLTVAATGFAGALTIPILITAAAFNTVLLIDSGKSKLMTALIVVFTLVPLAVSFVISSSYPLSALILYPLFTSLPIWFTLNREASRSASIAVSAAFGTALFIIFFGLWVYSVYGKLNVEIIKEIFDAIVAPIGEMLEILSVQEIDGRQIRIMTTADIEKFMYLYKTALIGALVSVNLVFSYIITLITRVVLTATNTHHKLPQTVRVVILGKQTHSGIVGKAFEEPVVWRIRPNSVSAGVFILSYIVTLLPSAQNALPVWSAAVNIQAILMPVFLYCGAREIILSIRGRSTVGRLGRLMPMLCIILILFNPSALAVILSMFGVILTFRENRIIRRNITQGKGE